MKRNATLAILLALALAAGSLAFASAGKVDFKAGDDVYACGCGDACDCLTISYKAGPCSCGKELVKAKVAAVEDGKVLVKADGWEKARAFKSSGAYVCACGEACPCKTISQKPGKCGCGKDLKKAE
jgi:hypothetical protein